MKVYISSSIDARLNNTVIRIHYDYISLNESATYFLNFFIVEAAMIRLI